jgi:fatty acid desaturase/predicted heme/steroid binding protein
MGKGGDASVAKKDVKKVFTLLEVQKHRTPNDAWVIYNNKVYDVSDWYEHPGGAVIFTHAGDDMTDIFTAFHAVGSQNMIKKFYIGDLDTETVSKDERQLSFEKGYRDLRSKLVVMGMFKGNVMFYIYKCISNLSLAVAAGLMMKFSDNLLVHMASAVLLGLFYQQSGWLAHDCLHHQYFRKRQYGDLNGLLWGNVFQGYSVTWWKNKHNGHHAVTNLHSSSALAQDGDPDIDTMPVLAWSLKQAQSFRELQADGKDSPFVKFMIKNQAMLYLPILMVARLSWLNESFKLAFGLGAASENLKLEKERKGMDYPILEKVGILIYYAWALALSSGWGRFGLAYTLAHFMLSATSCGFFLGIVFGLGHNGMKTYDADARPDFWKLQVTTTRNITGGHGFPQWFVDWFCGGLQYQVDHHLFPTLPRHNLKKTHELVKSFCKEWNVSYHEADLVDGTREVIEHLSKVSRQFLIDFVVDGPTM